VAKDPRRGRKAGPVTADGVSQIGLISASILVEIADVGRGWEHRTDWLTIGPVVLAFLPFVFAWARGIWVALNKVISWQYQFSLTASEEEG
jgi:hypothetical protein